jgi:hypothetical protein
MSFIMHQGGDVKEGKSQELQDWLRGNENAFADAHPAGTKYLGTYFSIYASDKKGGQIHTFTEMDSYGAQDAYAAASGGDGTFAKLLDELASFNDGQSNNWTSALYKKVTAASIFGE